MSTDAFTTAARAEAERKWPYSANPDPTPDEDEGAALNAGFMTGAEWARAHLARQEVTDAEIDAAIEAGCWCGEHDLGPERDCFDCRYCARVILTAAKEARA